MVGGTLRDIRAEIRSRSCPDGRYEVLCGRSGLAPSVVAGLTFSDRRAASEAADLACTYRTSLRRYDPTIPFDDPLVHEVSSSSVPPLSTSPEEVQTRFPLFCHDVSGALFESLSEMGHRAVESAAMETYLTLAEVVDDDADFCLTMMWSLMSEMDVRLSGSERTAVVERAASLFAPMRTRDPVGSTLRHLESVGFLEGYAVRTRPVDGVGDGASDDDGGDENESVVTDDATTDGGQKRRQWELTFGEYALAERTGRLPTLPIAIDLLRRVPDASVRFVDGEAFSESRWRLRLEVCETGTSAGLVSVDIAENRWLNEPGISPPQE